jgi:sugar/nucleoside kinase (ribokinase family)
MKLPFGIRRRSDASFDVVTFGENSLDTLVPSGHEAGRAKQRVAAIHDLPGGQAATAAVACARLLWRARYAGVFGDDLAGGLVRAALARDHVDVVAVIRTTARTRRAVVLVDDATDERSVLEYRDPALNLSSGEIPELVFTDTRVLIVDAVDVEASIAAAAAARAAGVRTIVDVDQAGPRIPDLLRSIDLVVVPEAVVEALSGTTGLGAGLAAIGRESGAGVVVATLGPDGALAWCQGHEVRAPGRIVEVMDTTGAGDAFRAGLAAAWLGRVSSSASLSPELEDLLADANLIASLNCRCPGAQAGLPTAAEVPAHLRGGV